LDYKLVQLASGAYSIHSLAYGETFHPVIGPVAEAEALYVHQLHLRDRLTHHSDEFVIWDVGLGAAANALTVLRATRGLPSTIRLLSFDQTTAALEFALQYAAELGYFRGYEHHLQELLCTGRVAFADGPQSVDWELRLADFPSLLERPDVRNLPKPHVILFDAFSPAKNPAMWTEPLFANLFHLLDPLRPCALPTYSRSTMMRVTLLLAGFFVGVGHASGEKEETTLAANSRELITEPLGPRWLERARISYSAEPMWEPVYRQAPLSATSWEKLQAHSQFQP